MAHTYVFQAPVVSSSAGGDPLVTFLGTVDGVTVTATAWYSVYIQNAASAVSARNFIVGLLLAAWTAQQSPVVTNAPATGSTVTQ